MPVLLCSIPVVLLPYWCASGKQARDPAPKAGRDPDFRTDLAGLKRLSPDMPLMLERLSTPEEYRQVYYCRQSMAAEA
jgi:hypothetical protein